jgi:hypothetical protein
MWLKETLSRPLEMFSAELESISVKKGQQLLAAESK